ncbi:MAG: hypothetical protein ABJB16_09100, partial [Saprospiraceae bacterium]
MRKTTVTAESLLPISLPILSGFLQKFCRSYGVTWIVAFMIALFAIQDVSAQGPYCSGFNCTANDVQNPSYYIGNSAGVPILAVVCTPGQPVNNVYLWLTFTVTATNRYDINVIGDILLDSVYNHTFNVCLGDYASGTYTVLVEQVTWTCGAEMVVANNLFSWENQDDGNVPNTCSTCPPVSSKCHRFSNLIVQAPIVADFSIQAQCQVGQPYQVYTFTSQTSGGILPYSNFTWNFGAGSTPVPSTISGPTATGPYTVTYSSAGIRNVTLTATDNYGNVSTSTQTIDVQPAATASITSNFNPICTGGTAIMTATMTGGTATTWQWQYNNAGTWTNVGTSQSTYETPVLSVGSYTYRVIINQSSSCSAASANYVVSVLADPIVTISLDDNSICSGGTSILTATVTGGTGSITYQWQHDLPTAGTTWIDEGGNVNPFTTPVLTTGTHTYRVLITQTPSGCAVVGTTTTITVSDPPTVTVSNSNPNICSGGTSLLTALPSGGIGTNSYQWQQLVGATWTNVSTSQSYTTDVLTTIGTYTYRVILTQNSAGCNAISSNTTVTVIADPTVSISASALTICDGGTSLFTATVSGGTGAITYQWQFFTGGVWTNVGTNASTYTTSTLTVGTYTYRLLVTQAPGCDVVSASQVVTVVADPTIGVAITEPSICIGGTTLLTATVTGGTGTTVYQWQALSGGTWSPTGTNQNTYTPPVFASAGTFSYRVLVTQASGCSTLSANADITVVADPTVSIAASALTICDGGTSTFTATVTGGTGTTTYQWQFNSTGTTWVNVGINSNVYTTPVLTIGSYTYRLIVTQATGCSVQSTNQTVTVSADPTVSVSINNPTLCIGGTATLTATVTGGTGTIVYTWQQFIASSWSNVGTNSNVYTTPALNSNGTYTYRVIVARNSGCDVISSDQVVTVVSDPSITADPAGFVECIGDAQVLTVSVTGGTGTFTYQWQVGNTSTGPWTTVGAGNTYTPPSTVAQTFYYRVNITSTGVGCNALTSAVATVLVTGPANVSISVNNPVICLGGSSVITSNVTNGSGSYTYLWQRSLAGQNTWATAPSPNTLANYTVPSGSVGSYDYRVIVHDVLWNCGNPVSNTVNVVVQSQPTVSVTTNDAFICIGGTAVITSTPAGGSGTFTYQWQSSPNGSSPWTNVPSGGTSQNYSVAGSVVGTTYYRVLVTDAANNCTDPISNTVSVTVIAQPTASISTLTPVICIDGTFTITSAVNNGSGIYSYQWQTSGSSSGPWSNISINGNNPDYTDVLSTPGVRYYRVIINDLASGCSAMTTAAISITVNTNPTVTVTPAGQNICIGGTATLTANVTSGSGNFVYQWQFSPDGSVWQNVASGGNAVTYNPPTGSITSTYYRVLVDDVGSGCANPNSAFVFVNIHDQPTVSIAADNPIICVGGSSTIIPTITNGSGNYAYQWQQSANGTSGWSNVAANGTNANYIVPSGSSSSLFYRLILTDIGSGCADPISNNANVIVQNPPSVTAAASAGVICIGGSSIISSTVTNGSGFYTYQWQSSLTGGAGTWSNISGSGNGATYSVPSGTPGTKFYRVIVT